MSRLGGWDYLEELVIVFGFLFSWLLVFVICSCLDRRLVGGLLGFK